MRKRSGSKTISGCSVSGFEQGVAAMSEPTQIGDGIKVSYDGSVLSLEYDFPGDPGPSTIELDPCETMALLQFIEDQHTLLARRMAQLTQRAQTVSPEWKYHVLYRCWRYMLGEARIELQPRVFCDRGRWCATVTGVGTINEQDEFPRYFMDLERAQLEMQEWLHVRLAHYTDNEHDRRNRLHNQVRDLRDALDRIAEHLTSKEVEATACAYVAIRDRLAPGLDNNR